MKQFTDTTGRCWEFGITVGSVRRVKSLLKVDLLDLGKRITVSADEDAELLPLCVHLTTDTEFVGKVLFALVSNVKDITEDEFLERLGGEAYEAAINGLADELTDFFLRSGRTTQARILKTQLTLILKAYAEATKKMDSVDIDRAMARASKQLEAMDLNQMIDQEIDVRFGTKSSSAQASSELTPTL